MIYQKISHRITNSNLESIGVVLYDYFTLLSKVNPLPVAYNQKALIMNYFMCYIKNLTKNLEKIKGFVTFIMAEGVKTRAFF